MTDPLEAARLAEAREGDPQAFSSLSEPYRPELLVHCYRLLGSLQDAEDMVQETFLRAWRRLATFEGRASFRAWLYKIATNACLDALEKRPRRTLPNLRYPAADPDEPLPMPIPDPIWLEPFPDEMLVETSQGPEARYDTHESVTLAFLIALQLLPPRQRAVLLMRDVLGWRAREVAELLDLTVSAVNSALHRARVTLAAHYRAEPAPDRSPRAADETTQRLVDRYVQAWEAADLPGLLALLKEDAAFAMPPSPAWLSGRDAIGIFAAANIFAEASPGRWRLRRTRANGLPAVAFYQRDDAGESFRASALHVIATDGDKVAGVTAFFDAGLFPRFNLPQVLSV